MANSNLEIERKWWLPKRPEIVLNCQEVPAVYIEQGYLEGGLRLRRAGQKYFITHKEGSGLCRTELEWEVPKTYFESEWPKCLASLTKWRYLVSYEGYTFEIDEFFGSLKGLILLEVEFESPEEAQAFLLPNWVHGAIEVTSNPAYSNSFLAFNGNNFDPPPLVAGLFFAKISTT